MVQRALPYPLKGHFSFLKNAIKRRFNNNVELLKTDDKWYENVLYKSDRDFEYLYDKNFIFSDLAAIVEYVKGDLKLSHLKHIKEKYGELHYYYIAMEYVIVPLYQRAYDKAIRELEISN